MDVSLIIKKAEHRRIDALGLWCWRRLLRVPWTARRSNQSILKDISPEYSLEGLMLKLQYFGHLMQRTDSSEKTLMRERLRQEEKGTTEDKMAGWHHWLNGHEFEWTLGAGDGQGGLACCVHGVAKSWTWLSDWTELIGRFSSLVFCWGFLCLCSSLILTCNCLSWQIVEGKWYVGY